MKWLLGGLIFAAGVLAGWLIPAASRFHLSSEVDVGNVMNALATLLVALLIGYLYTSHSFSRQADNGLLLESLRDVRAAVTSLQQASLPCHTGTVLTRLQQDALVQGEREVSNAVHSLEHALGCCGVKTHRVEFEKLKDARSALKDILTDTPFPGPYDNAYNARISSAFKLIRDELVRLSFAVSRR